MPKPSPSVPVELLERARRGDRAAHAELYGMFAGPVFTLARRMLASKALAEDVLQETFVEVLCNIDRFRGDAEVGTWIKRIAINKCLMHVRSSWVSRRDRYGDEEPIGEGSSGRLDDQMALERALDRVPDVARAVVWLHDVEGYTHAEIGRLMGRTTSFSKSQLARAHERLRALLEGPQPESDTSLCTPELKTC
jgi:RNA polymerase sigma-70 factor (ECF subfamily)